MKQFVDYKTQFKLLIVLGFLTFSFLFFSKTFAQSVSEIRAQMEQKDADIAKLEREIAAYQAELNDISKQKNSLAGAIRELDITKKKLSTDIAVTQSKIDKTNLKIQSLGRDIGSKETSISISRRAIAQGIRETSEFEKTSIFETILSNNDFTEAWNDIENIVALREKTRENVLELQQVKTELEDTRQVTIDAKDELVTLKSQLSSQHKIIEQNVAAKNKLLAETKNNEASYQKLLLDRIAQKEAFESELANFEAQLKFIRDPSKLPKKGALAWPLEKIFVTSPFGPRARGFHSGTDFRASVGTPVMAVADGVVGGVGDTDLCCPGASFGKWVFIEHNNGLSTAYGHLSLISARKGQKVKRGAIIGYSGNTGSSTGPHLHLTVYISSGVEVSSFASKSYPGKTLYQPIAAKDAYLDPMNYLPSL
jgi:murein DD-endopeptidase MepM/ murein hydrolase activator NlpD